MASRFGGVPKFLLPISADYPTLLGFHIASMKPFCDEILVPTRSVWLSAVKSIVPDYVQVLDVSSATISETIHKSLIPKTRDYLDSQVLLGLPDTVFLGKGNPYGALIAANQLFETSVSLSAALFRTPTRLRGKVGSVQTSPAGHILTHVDKNIDQDWGWHWGALLFKLSLVQDVDSKSETIGHLIDGQLSQGRPVGSVRVTNASYLDCGNFESYKDALVQWGDISQGY